MNDAQVGIQTSGTPAHPNRRRLLAGLAAATFGGFALLSLADPAAADKQRRCIERCNDHRGNGDTDRERRKRCRRRCTDR
ncbi:MAG: hypothetical protein U0031_21745 [Thermomicrobiales bacterium]